MMNGTTYTIRDTVLVAHLDGEAVLLDMDSKNYFRLNDTAAFIWKALEGNQSRDAILAGLCETFDVAAAEAATALDHLLDELVEAGLIVAGVGG